MAEKYFDDMNSDVQISGKRHYQKSVDGYNRLPDVFSREDLAKSFGYSNKTSISMKLSRLETEGIILKITDGEDTGKFMKKVKMLT